MSQLQRMYGWALFALALCGPSGAYRFSSNAEVHVDATRAAVPEAGLAYLPGQGSTWFPERVDTITPRAGIAFCVCLIGVMPLSVDDRLCCGTSSR